MSGGVGAVESSEFDAGAMQLHRIEPHLHAKSGMNLVLH
jgi:hypothetical protein